MRRELWLFLAVFLVTLSMSAGCKRGADSPDMSNLGPSSAATTTVLPVGSPNCPGGGIGIYTGSDTNGNGVLEPGEVLKGSPVCDPVSDAGKPAGLTSLVMIVSEPSGTTHCAAGGLKVLSGPDANRNGQLDPNEIAFTEFLCNGKPGAGSAAGITVALPAARGDKKKDKKPAPAKKPQAAPGKASGKAAPKPGTEAKAAETQPVAAEKKAKETTKPAASNKEAAGSARPAVPPQGWTSVKVGNPQLASAAYKIEGRSITVRFTNLSDTATVRFKYTVRWKVNQNGKWVDDSSAEGIGFHLKPKESIDRDVRTQTQDIRDVVVDLDAAEAN